MAATRNQARSAQAGQINAEQQVQASQAACEELQRTLLLKEECIKRLQEALEERERELLEANERLRQVSITDGLTGLDNRRHLEERLTEMFEHGERLGEPFSCVMCDIDKFKSVNDARGHATGDALLKHVAGILRDTVHRRDTVARLGGDEFVVLAEHLGDDPGAASVAKLCGNFLLGTVIEGMAEALTLAEKCGLDRVGFYEMLTSTLFNNPIYKSYGKLIAEQHYQPVVAPPAIIRKDMNLVVQEAYKHDMPMPFANLIRDRLTATVALNEPNVDWASFAKRVSEDAGM